MKLVLVHKSSTGIVDSQINRLFRLILREGIILLINLIRRGFPIIYINLLRLVKSQHWFSSSRWPLLISPLNLNISLHHVIFTLFLIRPLKRALSLIHPFLEPRPYSLPTVGIQCILAHISILMLILMRALIGPLSYHLAHYLMPGATIGGENYRRLL